MTPERWRQVTSLFNAVQTSDVSRQAAFLDDACGNDAELRAEVEALLSLQRGADAVSTSALFADLPQLSPGTSLGVYRLDVLVGAGGMGQVYRATDTRLHRQVAIKVLVPGLAVDPEFTARFEREGRLLASLNHPNIASIYGLEEAEGLQALVLEFVDGPTLAERLERGALTVTEALTIARQIASALDAAHERGIIHRDLKPANIKIAPGGVVKVLDFGIARASAAAGAPAVTDATRTGTVIGTPAYMSPEQARGRAVDKRTDIWAFGCVLYEMLTGRAAFAGETASDTIARVLERDPAIEMLPAGLSPSIRRLVAHCLAKDPSERLRDIGDARLEIVDALSAPASAAQSTAQPTVRGRWLWLAAAAGVVIAVTALIASLARGRLEERPGSPMEFRIDLPPEAGNAGYGLAVSPDGRRIAFASCCSGGPQLWVHSLDSSETHALPGTEGARHPFWAPDGATVGFFTANKLERTDLANGPPLDIADLFGAPAGPSGASWNANGIILYSTGFQLFRIPASGGAAEPVKVTDDAGEAAREKPQFLSDNTHFIYYAVGPRRHAEYLASLDSAVATHLVDSDYPAIYAGPSSLIYLRGTALVAQSINLKTGRLEGPAFPVASNAAPGCVCAGQPMQRYSASPNGVLALVQTGGGSPGHLVWFDRTGTALTAIDQPPGVENLNPAISPDGKRVAVNRMDPQTGNWDIWTIDDRGIASRLTSNPAQDSDPVWSPNGKELAFVSSRDGRLALYKVAVDQSGTEQRLVEFDEKTNDVATTDWSMDGKFILYQVRTQQHPDWSVWALPLFGDRKPVAAVQGEHVSNAHVSPDGHWIAYTSFETGRNEVYIQRFMEPGEKKPIAPGGGAHPRWTRDGHELVYWKDPGKGGGVAAVDLDFTPSGVHVGPPGPLVSTPILNLIDARPHYDVTRDGERLLLRQPAGPQQPAITVIVNWMARAR
jgi:serine/threonine protein kinase/Tol biopolymer transport system component